MAPGPPKKRRAPHREPYSASKKKCKANTATTRRPPAHSRTSQHIDVFRFMDLPAELRNNCYEKVLEIYPSAWLSRNSSQHNLASNSSLVTVSRQIREEFLAVLLVAAPLIQTTVRNFNFAHLVAFFNRLSDAELRSLPRTDTTLPAERRVRINLFQKGPAPPGFEQLKRWLNRVEHPTKKGTKIKFEYVLINVARGQADLFRQYREGWHLLPDVLSGRKVGTQGRVEAEKIQAAIKRRPVDLTIGITASM